MIPHIPSQRQRKVNATKPFNDLVNYVTENKHQELHLFSNKFSDILNYSTNSLDKQTSEEKCIAIRMHGIADISTASIQMNAVSSQNTRCVDPTFHFILSWPEHEHPLPDLIFDAAEHAIKSLGLAEHQYVIAIHGNTDNRHCHIAVNRVHPITYRSHNIEWARKTLHLAARQSEIKHGWTNDNGIYIIEINNDGKKRIVLNPEISKSVTNTQPYAHSEFKHEKDLPPWHDPESLEYWLKTDVSRTLKKALPKLHDWNALHVWLAKHDVTLNDTGGGGMRLRATSPETAEAIDLPASKGLPLLKCPELEKRWGKFTDGATEPNPFIQSFPSDRTETDEAEENVTTPCIVPDLSHLTHNQLSKGVNHVLRIAPDNGIPPNPGQHLLHGEPDKSLPPTHRRGSLHELPTSSLNGDGKSSEMLLPDALRLHLGDGQPRQDQSLRRPKTSTESSQRSLTRDNSKREARNEQRAAARVDLRQRFSQYQRFVRENDTDHWKRTKSIQADRNQTLKTIREETKAAKLEARHKLNYDNSVRLLVIIAIDVESTRRKLQAESDFQSRSQALRDIRQPPLGWRVWLHEQANLGDQAALSALRGIVYQAQRDAKYSSESEKDSKEEENEEDTPEASEHQYRQLMARLFEEERKEIAIRSTKQNAMRPYEVDALLARYSCIQWRVTGNGNIEYRDRDGEQLFTDRGNRVTFDRARVSDEEIRLALVHAQQKFGKHLTLTGDDPVFAERMACLADDMGMTILNPELQLAIENRRNALALQITQATTIILVPSILARSNETENTSNKTTKREHPSQERTKAYKEETQIEEVIVQPNPQERLRAMVLSIDPRAKFVPLPSDKASAIEQIGPSSNPKPQTQLAANQVTEESLADHQEPIAPVVADTNQMVETEPTLQAPQPLTIEEWLLTNQEKPKNKNESIASVGRILHIAADGRWIQDAGRSFVVRLPTDFVPKLGDRVRVGKKGGAVLVPEISMNTGIGS
ncbi:hypothetical protein CAP31_09155 [Sulfuriferula sp. AH1]|uniref:relaxase/mobilization nuclease domain-containing protein n=1 Tax=Sulfuriferula sp. AH1 TaxID=1985873 RepID=UPI000B3B298C|nr:relaxase/mobilization nuclease domain-containing protein [Sulfuriferula sp. AH1]ARU31827.1 hypothetical protein CAP31_09155 [Sulfuriferula sp. AH1]